MKEIKIAKVCGLCFGSNRAIAETINACKEKNNVVVFKQILHNKNVVKKLQECGARVKEDINKLRSSDFVIIRAHGEPKNTYEYLEKNNIEYLDLTCPKVKAIHMLVNQKHQQGYKNIIIGKNGFNGTEIHPEVLGTCGWAEDPIVIEDETEVKNLNMSFNKYFLTVQTTFSRSKANYLIDLIKAKMEEFGKEFDYKNTICDAQKNINECAEKLARDVDVMVIVGGKNSSNTKELFLSLSKIKPSYHIETKEEALALAKSGELCNKAVGLTAGASTMLEDVKEIKQILEKNIWSKTTKQINVILL